MKAELMVAALENYRRLIASRYRAIKPTELGDLPSGDLWLSPKIDGELAGIEFRDGSVTFVTKGGREIPDCPMLAALRIAAQNQKRCIRIVGELYCQAVGNVRPRVGDVSAALTGNAALRDRLSFAGFDLLDGGDDPLAADHDDRMKQIRDALDGLEYAAPVQTMRTADRAEVRGAWQDWGATGKAEGLVARTRDGRIFKIKPDISIDAVIMAFTTRCDAPTQVRSVLLGLATEGGNFQLIGGLGGVGSSSQRETLFSELSKAEIPSSLRHPSSDGGIFRFVRPGTVVEVNCTDVQAEDSMGNPLQRWVMSFDGHSWRALSVAPGVSLLHPQLIRSRPDKQATTLDAGFGQIAQRCTPPSADNARSSPLPTAEIVSRRIWTKTTKDKVSVRKLLVWSTGRGSGDGWPAWVVHFTDFSPERKSPLDRTFRAAQTREDADAIAARLIEENVKKGWSELQ